MLINPKIFAQQNNIYKNKKAKITLPYSDDLIFYKELDRNIESGKTVTITFPNEKLTEDSGLQKRIASCINGQEFFDRMIDLAKTALDAYRAYTTENIFELWRLNKKSTQQVIYAAYSISYKHDTGTNTYFLLLKPKGKGTNNKNWLFLS